jgi:hypothetical protein
MGEQPDEQDMADYGWDGRRDDMDINDVRTFELSSRESGLAKFTSFWYP